MTATSRYTVCCGYAKSLSTLATIVADFGDSRRFRLQCGQGLNDVRIKLGLYYYVKCVKIDNKTTITMSRLKHVIGC